MVQTTVEQFAAELGLPASLLLEQLRAAGVAKASIEINLDESDKTALLKYLHKEHGSFVAKKKIILHQKVKNIDDIKSIQQEIQRLMYEISLLDQQRDIYFNMTVNELEKLYQSGKNEILDETELKIIRIALREKKQIKM